VVSSLLNRRRRAVRNVANEESVRMYISKYKQKLSNVVISLMVVLSNVVIVL